MAPRQIRNRQPTGGARVVPFRRGEDLIPSSALVRRVLEERTGADSAAVRGALVVAMAVAERGGGDASEAPLSTSELADRTGLTLSEAIGAQTLLWEAGVLMGTEAASRPDPDYCCALPALAALDWAYCRRAVEQSDGRLTPALAVLREAGRLSRVAPDGGGDWISPSVQELTEDTLYGRTAVTRALADLVRAGILLRAVQPSRRGLKIRLHPRALGGTAELGASGARSGGELPSPGRVSPASTGGGVRVEIGGTSLVVPPGSSLRLPEGMDYRLEIGPDGAAIVRVDD